MKGFKARTLLLQAAARNTSFIERARFLRLLLDSADNEMIFSGICGSIYAYFIDS